MICFPSAPRRTAAQWSCAAEDQRSTSGTSTAQRSLGSERDSGSTAAFSFVYEGDREGLATVLGQLVGAGARVTRFGPGPDGLDELSAALAEGGGRLTA